MVDVQRHGEIGIDAVGGGHRADGADLLLAGGDKIEISLGIDALQRLHRAQQNGHAAAIINGFAGITIIEQLGKAALQRDAVADLHQIAHALGAHAQIDIQILAGVVLFTVGGRQKVRRLGADDAHQPFTAVYHHAHAGQDARIHTAHAAHAQRTVLFDIGYHQADFVQMRAQHHLGAVSPDMADDAV